MGKIMKALAVTTGIGVVAATSAYALLAPRRRDEDLSRRWASLASYRFAHRGLHDNHTPAPENSLAAFRLAREWGYGSELDVHLTADGQLVVIHDSQLARACGVEGVVEEKTLPELRELRLFGTKERIPTLAQVLKTYEDGIDSCPPLVVELKSYKGNYVRLAELTMALLDAYEVPYCVESFDPRVLWWLRRHRPDVIRGQLSEHFLADKESDLGLVRGALQSVLAINVAGRPDFVAYRFEHRNHPAVMIACGVLGAWRVYWTVQDEDGLDAADAEGAVSIFEGFTPSAKTE